MLCSIGNVKHSVPAMLLFLECNVRLHLQLADDSAAVAADDDGDHDFAADDRRE